MAIGALHGLSRGQCDTLRARSGGRCQLCGIAEADTPRGCLVVDHSASGAYIRGVLCDYCNTVIMACFDGTRAWSGYPGWEERARAYDARARHAASH